jgi:C-terminal peptidase prc
MIPDHPVVRLHGRPGRRLRTLAFSIGTLMFFTAGVTYPIFAQSDPPTRAAEVSRLAAKAQQEALRGQIFDAIDTLGQAVELAPERLALRLQLAKLQKSRGMWIRSAEQYRIVLDKDPGLVEASLGYGELLLADYQFQSAADQFQVLLEGSPPHKEKDRAIVGLGMARFGLEEYKKAAVAFDELLKDHPENPTARAYKNLALRKLGDLDGTIAGWREFLRRKPGVARAEVLKREAEELKAGIIQARKAIADSPQDPRAHLNLGDLLAEKFDLGGAIISYQTASGLAPGRPDILMRLGLGLRDTGRCRQAAEHFQVLAANEEFAVIGGYNLGHCAKRNGQVNQEVAAWNGVVEASPRDGFAYRKYLDALSRAGRLDQELKLLADSIKGRQSDPLPRIQYGILAANVGMHDESAKALLDALSLEPNDIHASRELTRVLSEKPGLAAQLQDELDGKTGKGDRRFIYSMSSLLGAIGKSREAAQLMSGYLAAHPDDARASVAMALYQRASGKAALSVLPLLKSARTAEPGYFHARLHLAVVLESLGQFEQAVLEAREAVRISANDPHAMTILGAALRGQGTHGSLTESFNVLQRTVRLDPMDTPGSSRLLFAKVAWQLGHESDARLALGGDLPVDPQDMYSIAWEFVRDSYGDRTFNGQNWGIWRNRFDGRLKTRADALGAIALMLASLDDRDTRLRSLDQTTSIIFAERSTKLEKDPSGRATLSSKTVKTSLLEENVGYLAVSNMADPKLVKEFKEAVGEMEERDSVILDLRGNQGGAEREVQQITALLVPEGTPTGTIVTNAGTQVLKSGGDSPPPMPEKPMVVLVDEHTASSAEVLAVALRESGRAVIVGNKTYGKAGIQVPRLLPDGTTLLVAVGESGNLKGESFAGVGIEPDIELDQTVAGSLDPTSDPAVRKAQEILRKSGQKLRRENLKKLKKETDKDE